jgi:serine/threonine protein kinase/Flp pilus assembly protein TadD
MTPERWQRVEELYHAARARQGRDSAAFLADACAGDEALRREVESLLAHPASADAFLAQPAAVMAAQLGSDPGTTAAPPAAPAGSVIGPYHLLQRIGHGGMGEVWQAEQKQPVRRRVAVKLIKAGMDTREVVSRFESERQALALMDHPAIAKVFDAGSTLEGRPYFVMEYVAGIPITDYCDKHRLTTRQRLELFILVCDGVQHAHQKAIIHRDLKPSNILVVEVDGKPLPRIIDFGVAKATSQSLSAATLYTRVGAVIGTLGYMSPEQAESAGEDIDTRTDVYALGVVLYELLVGELPFDVRKLAPDEVRRRLREQDAPRPSTKVRTLGGQSATIAQNRGTDPPTLIRQLRGDPDAIVLKALEKDRGRRYGTPAELAADIGRSLRHEPVLAHSASAAYRTRKYIRRHRIGVGVAAAVAVLLVSVAVAQAFAVARITRERDRADRITTFMTDMFKVSDPSAARGNSITAREILDKASTQIDPGLSRDPELQAQMMHVMGDVYEKLGLYPQAQSLVTRAVDIRRQVLGPRHPDTLTSMASLAGVLWREGHYPEAEKLAREIVEIRRRVLGPEHPDTLMSMQTLANVLNAEGRYAEAEKLHRQTLEIRRRVLGPEHPDTLESMNDLAIPLELGGRFGEPEKLFRETLEIRRRVLGPEHPNTLQSMSNLAEVLSAEGRNAEAEKLFRENLEIDRRVLGPKHPDTLMVMNNLAVVLDSEGRLAEAEKLIRDTLVVRRSIEPEHPDTLESMNNMAGILTSEGRLAEAEKLIRETLNISRRVLSPEHPLTADSTYTLGLIALRQGKRDEALEHLQEAVDHGLTPQRDLGIEKDPDLKSLHGDARFDALVAHAKERAAAAQQAH